MRGWVRTHDFAGECPNCFEKPDYDFELANLRWANGVLTAIWGSGSGNAQLGKLKHLGAF